jgi:hypothetical protein
MWSFPTPKGLPISLYGMSSRILRIIGTLNCETESLVLVPPQPILSYPYVSIDVGILRTCKANVDSKLEVRNL